MNAAIEVQNVTKRFGRKLVLEDISFSVPAGSVFAILGENGAGKTTLIRILLGLERPTAGNTRILSSNGDYSSAEMRYRVGYVPERPTFHEWMTIAETGWFTAGFLGDEFHQRYLEQVKHFNLPLDSKIKHLSKGMRTKVALSLALAKDPEVLILDEPTSGLDTLIRREVLESMVDLAASGKTVFLCSHQIQEVERVADHVVLLQGHRLKLAARLEKLKCDYVNVKLTMTEAGQLPPRMPGEVLNQSRSGRQYRMLVHITERDEADWERIAGHSGVETFEKSQPSLEDLFVGIIGGKKTVGALEEETNETLLR